MSQATEPCYAEKWIMYVRYDEDEIAIISPSFTITGSAFAINCTNRLNARKRRSSESYRPHRRLLGAFQRFYPVPFVEKRVDGWRRVQSLRVLADRGNDDRKFPAPNGAGRRRATASDAIRPFRVNIPEAQLRNLRPHQRQEMARARDASGRRHWATDEGAINDRTFEIEFFDAVARRTWFTFA